MEGFILGVHVLVAVLLVTLVLLQQGKGAEMGASFGSGASQTVFGSAGNTSFLTKLTWGLALVFFVLSLALAWMARRDINAQPIIMPASATAPAKSGATPAVPAPVVTPVAPANGDVPAVPVPVPAAPAGK